MISIHLPDEVERRLTALAATAGQPASFFAERAIVAYIDDWEDYAAAEKELTEVRAGRSVPVSLDDMLKTCGVAD